MHMHNCKATPIFCAFALALFGCEQGGSANGPEVKQNTAANAQKAQNKDTAKEEPKQKKTAGATVGQPAPDFTLTDARGKTHRLSDYRGKTVVLEWTNPECPFVKRHAQAKTMTRTFEQAGDDVVWLAVDSSHFVKPKDSKAWKSKHDIPYPILQDPEGKVGQMYAAKTTPHMFVIDGKGIVRYAGAIDNDPHGDKDAQARTNYVGQAIDALAAGKKPEVSSNKPYGCSVKYGS